MIRTSAISLRSVLGAIMVVGCVSAPPPPPAAPLPPMPEPAPASPPPPQPAVGMPVAGGTGVAPLGSTAATPGGIGSLVGPNWVASGFSSGWDEGHDWVGYHMTERARQYASGMVAVTDLVRARMRHDERRSVVVSAAAGHCYRVIGVGGAGVRDLDLFLRDTAGHLIDQDRAPDNYPVIGLDRQLCLPVAGTVVLEIHMFAGEGEVGVQAFGTP